MHLEQTVRRLWPSAPLICALVALFTLGLWVPERARADDEEVLPLPPVKVLQNRFFKKALRPEVSGFVGSALNESYTRTFAIGARLGFFFNEWVGLDYTFTQFEVEDSADLKALRAIVVYSDAEKAERTRIEPAFVSLDSLHAFTGTLAPVYGKINLFDAMILYSDIYFSAGAGLLQTSQGEKIPLILGVGQRFYFAKRYNVRIDAWDHVFEQERENLGEKKVSTKHAWVVSLGLSAFLW